MAENVPVNSKLNGRNDQRNVRLANRIRSSPGYRGCGRVPVLIEWNFEGNYCFAGIGSVNGLTKKTGALVPRDYCLLAARYIAQTVSAAAIGPGTPAVRSHHDGCRHICVQPAIHKHDTRF